MPLQLSRALKAALEAGAPSLAHQLRCLKQIDFLPSERELEIIHAFIDRSGVVVDVGANHGVYSEFFSRRLHVRKVIAFEPISRLAGYLRIVLPGSVEVINAALSDRNGETAIRIPFSGSEAFDGAATIDEHNNLSGYAYREEAVRLTRLDDSIGTGDRICFIKIDVEGHEAAVLRGARGVLQRDRPNMLIEIEDRHNPGSFAEVMSLTNELDYRCFFYQNGCLNRIPFRRTGDNRARLDIFNYIFLS